VPRLPPWLQSLRYRLGPVTFTTMAICLVLQVLFGVTVKLAGSELAATLYAQYLALSLAALANGHIWTLLTYGALHDLRDPLHVIFNCLALFYFMPLFEKRYGTRATLRFLLLAVFAGGVVQGLWQFVEWQFFAIESGITVGISAAVMAFIAAFGWMQPNARVQVMLVLPLEAKWLAPLGLAVDFLFFVSGSNVAFFAHLGGYLAAWFLIWGKGDPRFVWQRLRLKFTKRKASKLYVIN
jgi:membrane associated rhomboid family serine protease